MIQEAISNAGEIVKNHWAGGISGGVLVHFIHIVGPWLKANGTIKGVWKNYIWAPKPPPISQSAPEPQTPPKP